MSDAVFRFAEVLRSLLHASTPTHMDSRWSALDVEALGWDAIARVRRSPVHRWERVLVEVDELLLSLLRRVPEMASGSAQPAVHLRTFRLPALERLQHAAAAALVCQRYGLAGLHTVIEDQEAPLARRYFAFVALAERHPADDWPLFCRYLSPRAHHAFVGTATEAARFYSKEQAAPRLVTLFQAVRHDPHLRAFLSPRILESLLVLRDQRTLPFFRSLLTAGHTASVPDQCEVTHALVAVRRLTGRLEPCSKFRDIDDPAVVHCLDAAESLFDARRNSLRPVTVI